MTPYGTPDPRITQDAVAAWGDSFTEGGYPWDLADMVLRPVFNGGVSGETSSQILKRVLADSEHIGDIAVFWMGRNNFEDPDRVKADIAAAVAHQRGHFIVLSIMNGDYPDERAGSVKLAEILQLNAELRATYPENYLDVRSVLVGSSDIVPAEWRADELHLNGIGNYIVADEVVRFIESHGW